VGRADDSFVTLDLMRLPLGILSGVGFLGAGVIFRRSDLVVGVTTAAILWIATVIGLCFGGGQLALGAIATALGTVVLWGLKWLERYIPHELRAELILIATQDGPTSDEVVEMIHGAGYQITGEAVHHHDSGRETRYDLRWSGPRFGLRPPAFVAGLATKPGVHDVKWRPQGVGKPTG
jgi:putative Mg2+ transporter-C (MgtC) family protein